MRTAKLWPCPSPLAVREAGADTPHVTDRDRIKYAKSGDVAIAYAVSGQGPPDLVFVHGFAGNIEIEYEIPFQAAFLERLAGFSRLITFDRRGTGLSDRLREPATLEVRMDDLRAVLDAVGSERAPSRLSPAAAEPLPGPRGRHRGGWIFRHVRRPDPRHPGCARHRRIYPPARRRDPRRITYGRDRGRRRQDRGDCGQHRGSDRGPGWTRRSPGLLDREGPRRGLRASVRRARQHRAERHPGQLAAVRLPAAGAGLKSLTSLPRTGEARKLVHAA